MADLPDEPSYEQLRNQAKDLRRAVLAGEPGALAEVAEHFPGRDIHLVGDSAYGCGAFAGLATIAVGAGKRAQTDRDGAARGCRPAPHRA